MWITYIVIILTLGLWIYHWMTKKLGDPNDLPFSRQMDAVKAAEEEAERWRKVSYFNLPPNVPPPPWNPDA
jgi:hypothetical protein